MGWRRRPRTLNEELLAEGPREADPSVERPRQSSHLGRIAVVLVAAVAIAALKLSASHLPGWFGLTLGTLFVSHYVFVFVRSTKRTGATAGKGLRAFLLVWLALCVVATVLIAPGGFQEDDLPLLGVMWPVLALIWVGYRLRVAAATPRPETGSDGP